MLAGYRVLVAASKPVLPAPQIGELCKAIGALDSHSSPGRSMEPGSQRITARSWHVVTRFCLKLALFLIVCGFQVASGGPNLLFEMTMLAALLCVILAVRARERPIAKSLNYWDEALVFGLISLIGRAFPGAA